nr:hypothetical protein StreXyl84_64770 [Streptomyces sp. Xyl84]
MRQQYKQQVPAVRKDTGDANLRKTDQSAGEGEQAVVDSLGDSPDRALEGAFTRRIPRSAQAQMKYLVKQPKGANATAQPLGIPRGTVERYVPGKLKRGRQDLRGRTEREVKKRWQPQVRAKARRKAASTERLVVSTRARFGFTVEAGHHRRRLEPRHHPGPAARVRRPAVHRPRAGRHRAAAPADRGRRPRPDVLPRQQPPSTRPGCGVHGRGAHRDRAAGPRKHKRIAPGCDWAPQLAIECFVWPLSTQPPGLRTCLPGRAA